VFLIFGVRRRGYRMANVFAMCGTCHTPAAQAVVRVRTFFTFFFIPLIPLGSKYRSTCTMCGAVESLTRVQADAAVANARQAHEQAQAGGPPPMPAAAVGSPSPAAPSVPAPAPATDPDAGEEPFTYPGG
jgi:hypothetical protein